MNKSKKSNLFIINNGGSICFWLKEEVNGGRFTI